MKYSGGDFEICRDEPGERCVDVVFGTCRALIFEAIRESRRVGFPMHSLLIIRFWEAA